MGLSFSVKLHLYLTGLNFNTLWVKKNYLYINEVELFISHSLVTKTGMSDNQENKGNNKITELRTILQRESPNS